jgi:tyrosine decarboxylase/aspartate 1-decarboxylase
MLTSAEQDILNELAKLRKNDFTFASGHILGSMCTQPHPIAKEAYIKFLETNLGDPELFPGTQEIESQLIQFIADLLHAPETASGLIVSGGTEGNITAMWIAKQLSNKKEILIPEGAHFSFQKIASLMDVNIIPVPLTKAYVVDVKKLKTLISGDTAGVVGIAGSTELGMVDPIPEISDFCTDEDVFLHVDAAFGGFVIPFLQELGYDAPDFDFTLDGVSTISVDAHKMGWSAIALGTLIVRNKRWLEEISVESTCISSERQAGILGTRSGGPVAAAYAVANYLGREGYKNMVEACMTLTEYTAKQITNIGLQLVTKPRMNVLGVKLRNPVRVVEHLSRYGWRVNKINRLSCIRIVLMPHVTRQIIDEFIPVLEKTCKEFGEL